jgi:hypothetical protein
MIRIPTHRTPTHPGEMLLEEFLKPMGISQKELAQTINVPYQRINFFSRPSLFSYSSRNLPSFAWT